MSGAVPVVRILRRRGKHVPVEGSTRGKSGQQAKARSNGSFEHVKPLLVLRTLSNRHVRDPVVYDVGSHPRDTTNVYPLLQNSWSDAREG